MDGVIDRSIPVNNFLLTGVDPVNNSLLTGTGNFLFINIFIFISYFFYFF